MEVLVVYDIDTHSSAGERRLREVAKVCEGYGHRVQKSVFECRLDSGQARRLQHDLRAVIDENIDRVAIYRLREPYPRFTITIGSGPDIDWRRPIII